MEYKTLRIYISSTDKFQEHPLYEIIVKEAHRNGMEGATVLKGIMGFGAHHEIHKESFWDFNEKIPLVIEVVDVGIKIDRFVEIIKPYFDDIHKGCIVTVQSSEIIIHK